MQEGLGAGVAAFPQVAERSSESREHVLARIRSGIKANKANKEWDKEEDNILREAVRMLKVAICI